MLTFATALGLLQPLSCLRSPPQSLQKHIRSCIEFHTPGDETYQQTQVVVSCIEARSKCCTKKHFRTSTRLGDHHPGTKALAQAIISFDLWSKTDHFLLHPQAASETSRSHRNAEVNPAYMHSKCVIVL